jgi:hypothetical protein
MGLEKKKPPLLLVMGRSTRTEASASERPPIQPASPSEPRSYVPPDPAAEHPSSTGGPARPGGSQQRTDQPGEGQKQEGQKGTEPGQTGESAPESSGVSAKDLLGGRQQRTGQPGEGQKQEGQQGAGTPPGQAGSGSPTQTEPTQSAPVESPGVRF